MAKVINICLARIESKRIPRKLLKDFCGKPLIQYTIEFMQKLPYESYLYTDSVDIAKNFMGYKINIKDKPVKYCQDTHLTNIELKEYNEELQADVFIYLAGTTPMRNYEKIKAAIDLFLANLDKYDCAMGVIRLKDRMYWTDTENGKDSLNFKLTDRTFNNSSTFKKPVYVETGSIYIFKKELLENNFFINEKCLFIEDDFCHDMDTEEDWQKAEKFYKEKFNNEY